MAYVLGNYREGKGLWETKGNCSKGTATIQHLLIVLMWEYEPRLARSLNVSQKGGYLDSYMELLDFLMDGMLIKFSVKAPCNENMFYTISNPGNVN